MRLRIGQVVVQEAGSGWFSRAIARHTDSLVSHAFIATVPGWCVEAWFPRVRRTRSRARLEDLQREDRAYAVLDLPGISFAERCHVAATAESYVGRWYDVGQILLHAVTGRFWNDGTGTLVCSRVVTGAFYHAGIDLFPAEYRLGLRPAHEENLANGWATPADLLRSKLEVVAFQPSSRVREPADLLGRI